MQRSFRSVATIRRLESIASVEDAPIVPRVMNQTTNLGVRSSNLFGRATYATGGAQIIFMIGFYP